MKTNKQQIVLGLIKTLEGSIKPVNSETRTINIVVYIGIDKPTATSLVKHDSTQFDLKNSIEYLQTHYL